MQPDIKSSIKELALSIPVGSTERSTCPLCGRTDSFYITRTTNAIKYIDFSVHCGLKGIIGSTGGEAAQTTSPQKSRKLFTDSLDGLDSRERRWLSRKFLLPLSSLKDVRYGLEDTRIYYPMFNQYGAISHYIARHYRRLSIGGRRGAKAINKYMLPHDTGLCFTSQENIQLAFESKRIVLLEDWPSAHRVYTQIGLATGCLGGTQVYASHLQTLLDMGMEEITFLLDSDAIVKAVSLARSMSLAFPKTTVIPLLGADPKDLSYAELEALLEGKE